MVNHIIEGGLLMICADTLAAHWLGLQGSCRVFSVCQLCDGSDTTIKTNVLSRDFQIRTM